MQESEWKTPNRDSRGQQRVEAKIEAVSPAPSMTMSDVDRALTQTRGDMTANAKTKIVPSSATPTEAVIPPRPSQQVIDGVLRPKADAKSKQRKPRAPRTPKPKAEPKAKSQAAKSKAKAKASPKPKATGRKTAAK